MRKNGCRAPLTFTFLTLAIEHKFVNEQKKMERIIPYQLLGKIKIRSRSTHDNCMYYLNTVQLYGIKIFKCQTDDSLVYISLTVVRVTRDV